MRPMYDQDEIPLGPMQFCLLGAGPVLYRWLLFKNWLLRVRWHLKKS